MSTLEIADIGSVCTSISRALHSGPGIPVSLGAVQIGWEDSSYTVIDVNADWTISVAQDRWVDPFRGAKDPDLGHWELVTACDGDPLARVLGGVVISYSIQLNRVGELYGIEMMFDRGVLRTRVWGGDLLAVVDA